MSDPVAQHRSHGPSTVPCAVITASDSRTEATDDTGRYIREALASAGHGVEFYGVVRDDVEAIRGAVGRALGVARVVILNGGTGLAPRDVTLEALEPLWSKRMEGFGELFRMLSYRQVGSAAMMSRAAAGIVGEGFVACLPGSPAAARLAMEQLLLPELGHIAGLIEGGLGRKDRHADHRKESGQGQGTPLHSQNGD